MKNLKALIVMLFIIASITSCKSDDYKVSGGAFNGGYNVEEKTIDGCQYLITYTLDCADIEHKANCNNPFHNIVNR